MVSDKRTFILGIGAPRSGTTWLYKNIRASSELYLPPVKELRFFNPNRGPEEKATQAEKILKDPSITSQDKEFIAKWRKTNDGDRSKYVDMFPDQPKIGEISPIYSNLLNKGVTGIKETLEEFDTKVFYMMRNPFFRDLSHIVFALHRQKKRTDPYTVEEYRKFIGAKAFVRRSNYQRNVRVWRNVFKKDLKVFYFDELEKAPKIFFKKFCKTLELNYNPKMVKGMKENKSGRDARFKIALPNEIEDQLRERHLKGITNSKVIAARYKTKWQTEIDKYFDERA